MSQACSVAYSSLVHLVAIEWPRVIDYSQDISEDVISIAVFLLPSAFNFVLSFFTGLSSASKAFKP